MLNNGGFRRLSGILVNEKEISLILETSKEILASNAENDICWNVHFSSDWDESSAIISVLHEYVSGKLQIDNHEIEKVLLQALAKDAQQYINDELTELKQVLELVKKMALLGFDQDSFDNWVTTNINKIDTVTNSYLFTVINIDDTDFLSIKEEFAAIEGHIQLGQKIFQKFNDLLDKVQDLSNLDKTNIECCCHNYQLFRMILVAEGPHVPEDVNLKKENVFKFLTIKASDVKELFELLA